MKGLPKNELSPLQAVRRRHRGHSMAHRGNKQIKFVETATVGKLRAPDGPSATQSAYG
jgi:hypothetical protein